VVTVSPRVASQSPLLPAWPPSHCQTTAIIVSSFIPPHPLVLVASSSSSFCTNNNKDYPSPASLACLCSSPYEGDPSTKPGPVVLVSTIIYILARHYHQPVAIVNIIINMHTITLLLLLVVVVLVNDVNHQPGCCHCFCVSGGKGVFFSSHNSIITIIIIIIIIVIASMLSESWLSLLYKCLSRLV